MDTDNRHITKEMRPRIERAVSELQSDRTIRGMLDFDIRECGDIVEELVDCKVSFSYEGKEILATTLRFNANDRLESIKEIKQQLLTSLPPEVFTSES